MMEKTTSICCILTILSMIIQVMNAHIQCQSQEGKPVDWFIAYKVPGSKHGEPENSFFYMDPDVTKWTLSPSTLTEKSQAIFYTLDQIYEDSFNKTGSQMFIMYNDEPATSNSYGHTKGVISFDHDTGFWLIHSTPKFPPPKGQDYSWPDSASVYGQTFLCISLNTDKNMDIIGEQLQYNNPGMYDTGVPDYIWTQYPKMSAALKKKTLTQPPYNHEARITSLAGTTFYSFAKSSKYAADLYSAWLAPRFQSDLLVESWQNGRNPLCSNCSGKYHVYNINTIQLGPTQFTETTDHAKWAVTQSGQWTCIGDINRQKSQMYRPGGTVCFQNADVWKQFQAIVGGHDECGKSSHDSCVKNLI